MWTGSDPKALIFDFDGTLADTMPLHWKAWCRALERYGLHMTEERFYTLGGVPSRHIIRMLGEEQSVEVDPMEASHFKETCYLEMLPEVQPVRPIYELAKTYKGQLPLGVATGGTRKAVGRVMDHLGIRDWIDAFVTSEDVVNQKPAPDIFLEAARRLGVDPADCVAFEDTDLGMTAIRAAGMRAIDVREVLARS